MTIPVNDTALHILKAIQDVAVQDVESTEDTLRVSFANGAKLIIYDGEFEDE